MNVANVGSQFYKFPNEDLILILILIPSAPGWILIWIAFLWLSET